MTTGAGRMAGAEAQSKLKIKEAGGALGRRADVGVVGRPHEDCWNSSTTGPPTRLPCAGGGGALRQRTEPNGRNRVSLMVEWCRDVTRTAPPMGQWPRSSRSHIASP